MVNKNVIVESAIKAEKCQRNWDYNKSLSVDDLEALIKIATTMPTKQNQEFYQLIVSTDVEFNKEIYKISYFTDSAKPPSYKNHYNYQVAAHALFLWCPYTNFSNKFGDYNSAGKVCIGISAGAVALSAKQLGYRTGFCACFNQDLLIEKLNDKLNLHLDSIEVGLGIGFPNLNFASNEVVDDNNVIKVIEHRYKTIKVHRV
jgi:nitroreductase